MDRKIRIAQYGCGKMSHYLMRYVLEKGGELVAAFDMNPAMIGTDIGTHLGMEKLGITISDAKDASEILSKEKPDVCIIANPLHYGRIKRSIFCMCTKRNQRDFYLRRGTLSVELFKKKLQKNWMHLPKPTTVHCAEADTGYVLGFSDHNSGRIYASHYKNLRKQQL